MVRLPWGLLETELPDWLFPLGTGAPTASHIKAATIQTFAREALGDTFPAYLVSNREALEIPTTEPVSSLIYMGNPQCKFVCDATGVSL
jgi:hypothetical protein